jgi:glycosyltransferase involved in cell wall biosynthesis
MSPEASSPPVPEPRFDGAGVKVLIPCFNEEVSIGKVVDDFRRELPKAEIVVYDNKSTDRTAALAREHGATVRFEKRQGKGFVINSMFRDEDAQFLVMVDGDDTYDAGAVHRLLAPLAAGTADVVVGARRAESTEKAFRPFHVFGNSLVKNLINFIFGCRLTDIMSGFRAFSLRVARDIPVVASGFEVETEMTLQLFARSCVVVEVPVAYRERPAGSFSKLRTVPDGIRVLFEILNLFQSTKPLTFFGLIGIVFFALGAALGAAVAWEFFQSRAVNFAGAMVATSSILLSFFSASVGVILHTMNFRFRELWDIVLKKRDR